MMLLGCQSGFAGIYGAPLQDGKAALQALHMSSCRYTLQSQQRWHMTICMKRVKYPCITCEFYLLNDLSYQRLQCYKRTPKGRLSEKS